MLKVKRLSGMKALVATLAASLIGCGGGGVQSEMESSLEGSPSFPSGATSEPTEPDAPSAQVPPSEDAEFMANSSARFASPRGIAADADGNLYIADSGNNVVRRIGTDGEVRNIAGMVRVSGNQDGPADKASFSLLRDITLDSSGNLFVTDGNSVRRVSSSGIVSTIAGHVSESGVVDGAGSVARFNNPRGLTFDASGNLLIADRGNNAVRIVSPDGETTTLLQSGEITSPIALDVDSNGALFIADFFGILKYSNGIVESVAGSYGSGSDSIDGYGANAKFTSLQSLTVATDGTIYVTEAAALGKCGGSHSVVRKLVDGTVTTLAGRPWDYCSVGGEDGMGHQARFWAPMGLTASTDGFVYVADSGNHTIRRVTSNGSVTTVAGVAGDHGSSN